MNHEQQLVAREAWDANHRLLIDIAYRMLGSLSDAEDVVQEAFARMLRTPVEIDDARAWLVVVVSRLCVDHLRSARVRREQSGGNWMPEPIVEGADPADRVTLDDSVRMALLIVLEQLSPAERACFVLHDVFQFSFETVATIVGRTPAACRQLASRARRHIDTNVTPARFTVAPEHHRDVVARFIDACARGDIDDLTAVLHEDVEGVVDTGGRFGGGAGAASGRVEVLRRLLLFFGPASQVTLEPCTVNGEPGALARSRRGIFAVISISSHDGRIDHFHSIADPEKLQHVGTEGGGSTS